MTSPAPTVWKAREGDGEGRGLKADDGVIRFHEKICRNIADTKIVIISAVRMKPDGMEQAWWWLERREILTKKIQEVKRALADLERACVLSKISDKDRERVMNELLDNLSTYKKMLEEVEIEIGLLEEEEE